MSREQNGLRHERLRKMRQLKAEGVNPFGYSFIRTHSVAEARSAGTQLTTPPEDQTGDIIVKVCGRITGQRFSWKFVDLEDQSGSIQCIFESAVLDPAELKRLKLLDRGDIIGVTGKLGLSRTGEISVYALQYEILSKSLQPIPDTWSSSAGTERRYRQRHLDFMLNPQAKQTIRKRSALVSSLRSFLDAQEFIEVETPVLHNDASGAEARPFTTHHNALSSDFYLRIATEMHLKRMIIGGFDKVYEIGRIFRNEGISTRHNPEFTMMELYAAYGDYHQMMDFTEAMIKHVIQSVHGSLKINYQGVELDFSGAWKRITMFDAIKEYCGVEVSCSTSIEDALAIAEALDVAVSGDETSAGEILYRIFAKKVEPHLVQPTFVIDYPEEVSWVQQKHRQQSGLCERFELFIIGMEYVNGCSELNDPVEQRRRFEVQACRHSAGDDEMRPVDVDFLYSMEFGMPPTMGIGLGIDRLAMLLTDSACIRDVIAFPLMKKLPAELEFIEPAAKWDEREAM